MASKFAISSWTHKSLENELQKMQNDVKKIKSDFPDWNWYLCHDIKTTGMQKFRKLDVILQNDLSLPLLSLKEVSHWFDSTD